ncbi:hypothetical protein K474DRAFT_1771680 [Panus rudis PR-1116 ss-1]|nr:hypothetical protein K474DRAFT_1771680 [Panus rudis PR-1116 ss-1]
MVLDYFLFYARSIFLSRCSVAAALTILYYDWLLTIPSEIDLYWQHRFSYTSFFYFLNRYSSLLAHVPVAVEFYVDLPTKSCLRLQSFHQVYCAISVTQVAVLLVIRTYALYNRSKFIVLFLAIYILVGFGCAAWAIVRGQQLPGVPMNSVPSWYHACGSFFSKTQTHLDLAIAWALAMGFDIMIFVLTLRMRLKVGRTVENGIFTLMMRDGTMYFGFIIFFYVWNMISILHHMVIIELATFVNIIGSTLVSRLMLNIRDPKNIGVFTQDLTATALDFAVAPNTSTTGETTSSFDIELRTLSIGTS